MKLLQDAIMFSGSCNNGNNAQDLFLSKVPCWFPSPAEEHVASKLDLMLTRRSGITLRGENGSGKSITLCAINQLLIAEKKKTFYFPCNLKLDFAKDIIGSTGEVTREAIEIVLKTTVTECFLLDEWDANFDDQNRRIVSEMLDQYAKDHLVIEIRHKFALPDRDAASAVSDASSHAITICFDTKRNMGLLGLDLHEVLPNSQQQQFVSRHRLEAQELKGYVPTEDKSSLNSPKNTTPALAKLTTERTPLLHEGKKSTCIIC